MKYTLTPILVKKIKSDVAGMVKIRIAALGKRAMHSTGIRVQEKEWDPVKKRVKSGEMVHFYNSQIRNEYTKIETAILELQLADCFTFHRLKTVLRHGPANKDFFEYVNAYIKECGKSPATLSIYRSELKRIRSFAGDQLSFRDIDHGWLRKYDHFLKQTVTANNTQHKAWKILRKFIRQAYDEKIIADYPIAGYKNAPRYKQTKRTYLLWNEVEKIEALLKRPLTDLMRKVVLFFLLGCYTGLRIEDWMRYNREGFIDGDRFTTIAQKNGEIVTIKINEGLQNILDQIGDERLDIEKQTVNEYLKGIGKMAGINKVLTAHVARHTFGTHCARLKAPDYDIAKLMGITTKTAKIYIHIMNTAGDDIMDRWHTA